MMELKLGAIYTIAEINMRVGFTPSVPSMQISSLSGEQRFLKAEVLWAQRRGDVPKNHCLYVGKVAYEETELCNHLLLMEKHIEDAGDVNFGGLKVDEETNIEFLRVSSEGIEQNITVATKGNLRTQYHKFILDERFLYLPDDLPFKYEFVKDAEQ